MSKRWTRRLFLPLLVAAVVALAGRGIVSRPALTSGAGDPTAQVKILAVNDLHGALEPGTVGMRPAGGVATLAAYLNAKRAETPHPITVHAGDMIGGSPPVSALLREEPAMEAMDLLGIELGSVGNHEFDRGLAELYRLVNGGCDAQNNCFPGVKMQYLAANVVDGATGQTVFPPYAVREIDGVRLGFIGVTLQESASIIVPTRIAGLRFLDEVETVNRYAAELKGMGVRAIVVLIHNGGDRPMGDMITGMEFIRRVSAMDAEVDVVVSAHSHQGYRGTIAGKLVTQAFARGTAFADIDITVDRTYGDVVDKRAEIITTFADQVTPDPTLAAKILGWQTAVGPLIKRVVGHAAEDILRSEDVGAEGAAENLVADAFRWAMNADIGCVNAGGTRADLRAGPVTWEDLFNVQPFGNELYTVRVTGALLHQVLNRQWANQPNPRVLRCSGLIYTWDPAQPEDQRVALADMFQADGTPIRADQTYTLAINSFLAEGSHNLFRPEETRERIPGPTDIEALVSYVEQLPQPFVVRVEGRIRIRGQ